MPKGYHGNLASLWAVGGEQHQSPGRDHDKGYYQFCPVCGWKLTGKFSTCPRCGADMRVKLCPFCGGSIPASTDHCPRCTASLIDEEK